MKAIFWFLISVSPLMLQSVWMGHHYSLKCLHRLCCLDVHQKLNQLFVYAGQVKWRWWRWQIQCCRYRLCQFGSQDLGPTSPTQTAGLSICSVVGLYQSPGQVPSWTHIRLWPPSVLNTKLTLFQVRTLYLCTSAPSQPVTMFALVSSAAHIKFICRLMLIL